MSTGSATTNRYGLGDMAWEKRHAASPKSFAPHYIPATMLWNLGDSRIELKSESLATQFFWP